MADDLEVEKRLEEYHNPIKTWGLIFIWFLILLIIIWIILFATNLTAVQKTDARDRLTGEPDGLKVIVAALILAIFFTLFIYIFYVCSWGNTYKR